MGLKWVGIALHDGDARTADGEILHFTLHPLLFSSMTLICISGCISAILISALSPIIESSVPAQRESRSPPPFTLHALSSAAFYLLREDQFDFLKNMAPKSRTAIRKQVIEAVLVRIAQ